MLKPKKTLQVNMDKLSVTIHDLPDEILMTILSKLANVEVLCTLFGVNKQLDRIAHDSMFVDKLTLFERSTRARIRPLPQLILDRFFLDFLPQIHHRIKWLDLESMSMEKILLATDYPSLCGLGLYGIDAEKAISLFTDDTVLTRIDKKKILSFTIDISENEKQISTSDLGRIVLTHILAMFSNLRYLKIGPTLTLYQQISFDILPPSVFSSTLLEVHVSLTSFTDCLYLLDGRFDRLHTLHVHIPKIDVSMLTIKNEDKLPNLRSFSLTSHVRTGSYDELLVPLLQRMFYLEKLHLTIRIGRDNGLVDAKDLQENIINYMARLKKFTFNICSFKRSSIPVNILSNEEIERIFEKFPDNRIISCTNHFPQSQLSHCHIYSYPYRLKHYDYIGNNFPGGLFPFVVEISLRDEQSFEHEFFVRIAQSFPVVERLSVSNRTPQKNKLHNDNEESSVIEYPHLTRLNLIGAHDDYIEQFLIDRRVCLPTNISFFVGHKALQRVTDNFRRDATRLNCGKVSYICSELTCGYDNSSIPQHIKDYFLHVNVN